jgi:hypothetical protein
MKISGMVVSIDLTVNECEVIALELDIMSISEFGGKYANSAIALIHIDHEFACASGE